MPKPTNGLIYIDGKWYMQCGPDLVEIKLLDKNGRIVEPDNKVSDS